MERFIEGMPRVSADEPDHGMPRVTGEERGQHVNTLRTGGATVHIFKGGESVVIPDHVREATKEIIKTNSTDEGPLRRRNLHEPAGAAILASYNFEGIDPSK